MLKLNVNNQKFNVDIEHKNIKNIYLRVIDHENLKVTCHPMVDEITIIKFINQKAKWISSTVVKKDEYQKKNKVGIFDGHIFYLDKLYKLTIKRSNFSDYKINNNELIIYINTKVEIDLNIVEHQEFILKIFYKLISKSMMKIINDLRDRLDLIISDYNLDKPSINVKELKGKWGFCVPQKNKITLNTKLIHYNIGFINEVLWHEYCHLVVPNHSKRFYQLFEAHISNK